MTQGAPRTGCTALLEVRYSGKKKSYINFSAGVVEGRLQSLILWQFQPRKKMLYAPQRGLNFYQVSAKKVSSVFYPLHDAKKVWKGNDLRAVLIKAVRVWYVNPINTDVPNQPRESRRINDGWKRRSLPIAGHKGDDPPFPRDDFLLPRFPIRTGRRDSE